MREQGPGQTLFTFVRHWSRRPPAGGEEMAERGRLVLITEAVDTLRLRGLEATINALAHEIGIDQSGASRLVKEATEAGYLSAEPSPTDRRQRQVVVTPSGHAMLEQAHDWQEQVFGRLAEGWSQRRRNEFQQAMKELVDRSFALSASPPA